MIYVLNIAAGIAFGMATAVILFQPFLIGKEKTGKYDAKGYMIALFEGAILILLSGHVFGWW